jgi:hypothetical protein
VRGREDILNHSLDNVQSAFSHTCATEFLDNPIILRVVVTVHQNRRSVAIVGVLHGGSTAKQYQCHNYGVIATGIFVRRGVVYLTQPIYVLLCFAGQITAAKLENKTGPANSLIFIIL